MTSVDLTERLHSFLDERAGSTSSFLLGVSGGCDSMVLLDVFSRVRAVRDVRGYVVHYNHRLQNRAGQAEKNVRSAALERNLEFVSACARQSEKMERTRRGLEAEARERRYDFFASVARTVNASGLLLAHHRRDQVETLLLNMGRGTGPAGLSGMDAYSDRNGYTILRPFLSVEPEALERYVGENDLSVVEDPSNEDVDRARNRIRHRILPEWKTAQPDPESAIYGLGERMKRENEFWEQFLDDRFEEVIYPGEVQIEREVFRSAHPAAQFRYLHRTVTDGLGAGRGVSAGNYGDLRELFLEGRSGARLSLPDPLYALNEYRRGCISTRRPPEVPVGETVRVSREEPFGEEGVIFLREEPEAPEHRRTFFSRIDSCSLRNGTLRSWEKGDCFQRDGTSSKLKELFDDWKIPYRARRCWPALSVDGTVVAVPGLLHEKNTQSGSSYFGFWSDHPVFQSVGSTDFRPSPPYIL